MNDKPTEIGQRQGDPPHLLTIQSTVVGCVFRNALKKRAILACIKVKASHHLHVSGGLINVPEVALPKNEMCKCGMAIDGSLSLAPPASYPERSPMSQYWYSVHGHEEVNTLPTFLSFLPSRYPFQTPRPFVLPLFLLSVRLSMVRRKALRHAPRGPSTTS